MSKNIQMDPEELYLIELHLRRLRLLRGQRGTEAREQRRRLAEELGRTNRAIHRTEQGLYGQCEHCGRPLDREVLRRNPGQSFCHRCQSVLERQVSPRLVQAA